MNFHCLFEQSGTFRDVFKSYGHEAYCYDIQNEYGKTDFQIDLFKEIEEEYKWLTCNYRDNEDKCWNKCVKKDCSCAKTIFDNMNPETDFIIAFFPCTFTTVWRRYKKAIKRCAEFIIY